LPSAGWFANRPAEALPELPVPAGISIPKLKQTPSTRVREKGLYFYIIDLTPGKQYAIIKAHLRQRKLFKTMARTRKEVMPGNVCRHGSGFLAA